MAMVPEIGALAQYVRLLWQVPTDAESWIQYPCFEGGEDGIDIEEQSTIDPWERVKFQVAGIPLGWKLFYIVVLVIPRAMILHFVLYEGVELLMETAGITDSVLSAVSMTFIADIGGMIFRTLAPRPVPEIMSRLRQPSTPRKDKVNPPWWFLILPGKVLLMCFVLAAYLSHYYSENCTRSADGTWVSKDMHQPQSTRYTLENLLLHNEQVAKAPFWSMSRV